MAKLYEYQGKELLREGEIPIPKGGITKTEEEARKIAEEIGGPVVIKAQAWVTGRAEAGGVRFARDPSEAEKVAGQILGMDIKGFTVREVLVEEKLDIEGEFYVGMTIDDGEKLPALIFSSVGGTGIEEIAREHPTKVVTFPIDITTGLRSFEARDMLRKLEIREGLVQTRCGRRDLSKRRDYIRHIVLSGQGGDRAEHHHSRWRGCRGGNPPSRRRWAL